MKKRIFTLLTCTIAGGLSLVGNAEAMTYIVEGEDTTIAIPKNIAGTTIKRCDNCDIVTLNENNTECEIHDYIDDGFYNALVCKHEYNDGGPHTVVYDGKGKNFESFSLSNGNVTNIIDFSGFGLVDNLYLNFNKLTYIDLKPEEEAKMFPINIRIENNQLTGIKNLQYFQSINNTRNLTRINLRNNNFTSITDEIKVVVFDAGNNYYYIKLDDNVTIGNGLDDSRVIDLSNNPIGFINIESSSINPPNYYFKRFGYSGSTQNINYHYEIINEQNAIVHEGNTTETNVTINKTLDPGSYIFKVYLGNKYSKHFAWDEFNIEAPYIEPPTPKTYTLTINYLYSGGAEATGSVTRTLKAGDSYDITSPIIPGYTADKPNVTGIMLNTGQIINVTYTQNIETPQTYILTIIYKYLIEGIIALPSSNINLTGGASYNITPPPISGYTANPGIVSGTMGNANREIYVYYIKNSEPTQLYTLTINYLYNGKNIAESSVQRLAAGSPYNINSPSISGYTPNMTTVIGTMPNGDKEIDVIYTQSSTGNGVTVVDNSNSSDLSLRVSNKNPDIDERVKLTINVNEKYTGKIYFPKMQYHNGSKRTTIDNTSSNYISDYSDELDEGEVQFRSSDEGSIIISRFIKFSRSGKFRIYAEDKYGDDTYVQINVADDDDDSSSSSSSDESNLTLSASPSSPSAYEPVDITIKTDNYAGKIDLYAKYRDPTSSYRTTISNNSIEYFSDYSNIWENGYYKMTSSDKGKKTLSNLVEFKKPGTYRIYAEDKNGYSNFIQIYVNENGSISSSSQNDDEIQRLLNELLNKSDNSDLGTSTSTTNVLTDNNSYTDTDEEVYISRSCKKYRIQYNAGLGVFTSPDLKKAEYFINKDYFKRYIDSKNKQVDGCPTNIGWISTSYKDTSNSSSKYTAPNGKVYFINQESGWYKSNELEKEINAKKNFGSIIDLKYFIRDRNPLINMDKVK